MHHHEDRGRVAGVGESQKSRPQASHFGATRSKPSNILPLPQRGQDPVSPAQ